MGPAVVAGAREGAELSVA